MAKKKLFGNEVDPRCDTCAHGNLSPDETIVLCRYKGALPKDDHCRKYVYDPLKRVPKRAARKVFTAEDFSLDDPVTQEEVVETVATDDVQTHTLASELINYLNSVDTPDTDAILAILHRENADESTQSLLQEADTLEDSEESADTEDTVDAQQTAQASDVESEEAPVAEEAPAAEEIPAVEETVVEEAPAIEETVVEEAPAAEEAIPEAVKEPAPSPVSAEPIAEVIIPDAVPAAKKAPIEPIDIPDAKDAAAKASTKAAFDSFSLRLFTPEDTEDPLALDEQDLAFVMASEGEDDEDALHILADDLIFMSTHDLNNLSMETLSLNEDGSITITSEDDD